MKYVTLGYAKNGRPVTFETNSEFNFLVGVDFLENLHEEIADKMLDIDLKNVETLLVSPTDSTNVLRRIQRYAKGE